MINRPTAVAFIDFLFVLVFIFCGATAVLMLEKHQHDGNVINKAEFVATLEWNENSNSDVDLWARNPTGDIVYFKNKDAGLMTLDRDDTGVNDDLIKNSAGQTVKDPIRREVISIRGIEPGQTTINVMLYALRDKPPVTAKVLIVKLNPYSIVAEKTVELYSIGQEITIASFIVANDGSVTSVDSTTQYQFGHVNF